MVERGGKVRDKARLGIRFTSVVLADGTRVPVETDTIFREGDSPTGESAAKIGGGAIGGAILEASSAAPRVRRSARPLVRVRAPRLSSPAAAIPPRCRPGRRSRFG
jgi:hypothetical protein